MTYTFSKVFILYQWGKIYIIHQKLLSQLQAIWEQNMITAIPQTIFQNKFWAYQNVMYVCVCVCVCVLYRTTTTKV